MAIRNSPPITQHVSRHYGNFLVIVATVMLATAGLFTRVVTTDLQTTIFFRSIFGGASLIIFYLIMTRREQHGTSLQPYSRRISSLYRFNKGEWVTGTLLACGMICLVSSFFFTSIANATFMFGLLPLVTFGLAFYLIDESATKTAIWACILAAIGTAIVVSGSLNLADIIGLGFALAMTFFVAAFTVATKFFDAANPLKIAYLGAFLAAISMLPFANFTDIAQSDYFWLALYGVTNLGIGFGCYFIGVKRTTAMATALLSMLDVILAPFFAWLLFAEVIATQTLIGGAVITGASLIYLRRQHQGVG